MNVKRTKIVLRSALLPSMMTWMGMLLACFAWMMQLTPLLTPLWSDNVSLGHGICVELEPIVSAAKHYEQIKADIAQTDHALPYDSAARHSHHHTAPISLAPPSTVKPIVTVTVDAAPTPALQNTGKVGNSDPSSMHYSSCDICTAMSAALLPVAITQTHSTLIELLTITVTVLSPLNTPYSSAFLRPFSRAPPQVSLA